MNNAPSIAQDLRLWLIIHLFYSTRGKSRGPFSSIRDRHSTIDLQRQVPRTSYTNQLPELTSQNVSKPVWPRLHSTALSRSSCFLRAEGCWSNQANIHARLLYVCLVSTNTQCTSCLGPRPSPIVSLSPCFPLESSRPTLETSRSVFTERPCGKHCLELTDSKDHSNDLVFPVSQTHPDHPATWASLHPTIQPLVYPSCTT